MSATAEYQPRAFAALVTPEQRALIAYLDRRNPGWDRRTAPRPDSTDRREAQ